MRHTTNSKTVGRFAHAGVVAAIVATGSFFAATASAHGPVAGEFDRLTEQIEGAAHPAERLAAAHMVSELRTYLPSEEYADGLRRAAERVDDPLAEFVAHRSAARARLEGAGNDEFIDDAQFADDHSCLVDWEIVGPFSNASMEGFNDRLAPELGESGPYPGRFTEVGWRELGAGHHLCRFQLNSRVHPSTSAVVYLSTTVEVEEARRAKLLAGSRSAYRIWVDGQPVGQRTTGDGFGIDAEGWQVDLDAGENEILVKLGSGGQGGLAWMARLVDEDGSVLDGWQARPGVELREVDAFEPQGMPDDGARVVIEEGVGADEPSSQLAAAMLWKRLYRDDSETPWRDVAESLEEHIDELSAREMIWLARLYEDLWRRQAIYDEAVERHDDPLLRLMRAEQRERAPSRLQQRRQRRELEALVDEHPGFLMAHEALAQWFQRHEGAERALRVVENWQDDDRHRVPAWVSFAAQLHDRAGNQRRAYELQERAAAVHRLSGTFGLQLVRRAIAEGDVEAAREMIADYQHRARWSTSWDIREAMLLRSSGAIDDAIAVVDALIAESPGDSELHRRKAEFLVVAGDHDGAMAAMEQAISHRPQAIRYQKYMEHLQPESTRFYEPWKITDLRELAEEAADSSRSYDRLVDQSIHRVASNGLSSEYNQRAHRVLEDRGTGGASRMRISFRPGDERVEVLGVRVYKRDGTIAEDYDEWQTGRTRQGARQYNDRGYVYLQANNVDDGDIVEFEYVVHQVANENFRGDYFGDISYVQSTRPIVKARYAVIYPDDWDLYFRAPRHDHRRWQDSLPGGEPVEDQRVEAFELRDVPRVRTESDQPGNTDVYDYVLVSNKETFDDVATWWWELIEEQLVVDETIAATVERLTEGLETDEQKLEAIHEYIVRNTRYLHVGLGIHGWKPYRTSTVYRNRYGDCKDKAALLKVMLEEAGIDAQMVLVRTRRLGAVDDHPPSMNVFNHAVTYVPSMDLFIDPTARFNGPWELTQMDQGAQALIVEDGGAGRWVTMPVDEPEDNVIRQTLEVDHHETTPVITGRLEAHGNEAVRDRRRFEDPERRNEDFEDRLRSRFSGLSLLEADYENLDELTEPSRIRYTAEVPGTMRGSDGNYSIYPLVETMDLLDRHARQSTRRQDLTFRVPFTRQNQVRHRLPDGKTVDRLPESTQIESPFGYMELNYEYDDGELLVDVDYAIEVQRIAVDDYPEFRRFVAQMDEAVNERIRLVEDDDEV